MVARPEGPLAVGADVSELRWSLHGQARSLDGRRLAIVVRHEGGDVASDAKGRREVNRIESAQPGSTRRPGDPRQFGVELDKCQSCQDRAGVRIRIGARHRLRHFDECDPGGDETFALYSRA